MSWGGAVRRWTRIGVEVLLAGGRHEGGDEIVELSARAVLKAAYPLGNVLVLPDHVVLQVPPKECRLLSGLALNNELHLAVENRVHEGVEKLARRLQRDHGQQIRVRWSQPLRLELRDAAVRRADAYFGGTGPPPAEQNPCWVDPVDGTTQARNRNHRSRTPRSGVEQVTLLDPGPSIGEQPVTQPLDSLLVTLSCDGHLTGSLVAVGHATVGRNAQATLLVPEHKERVSRRAAELALVPDGIQVRVHNRNGVWTRRHEDGSLGPRRKVPQGGQVILRVGDQLDLDRDATVVLTISRYP